MLTLEELKKADLKKLLEELQNARREQAQLRMAVKTSQSKDIHKLRRWKKYIAQIQTIKRTEAKAEVPVN
jgi:ribosomal protein L29